MRILTEEQIQRAELACDHLGVPFRKALNITDEEILEMEAERLASFQREERRKNFAMNLFDNAVSDLKASVGR